MGEVIKPVNYKYAGRESIGDTLRKIIPTELIPTEKTGEVIGILFLISVVWAIVQFPLGDLKAGNTNVSIDIGIPYTFLSIELTVADANPIVLKGLILDLLIYILIGYLIDVSINLIMNSNLFIPEKDKGGRPKIFKQIGTNSIAGRITEKIFEKNSVMDKKNAAPAKANPTPVKTDAVPVKASAVPVKASPTPNKVDAV